MSESERLESLPTWAQLEIAQTREDVAFLLLRADRAGSCRFGPGRWTGMSSNALVAVAFGGPQSSLPSDREDYAACVRTYARLPVHRRTPAVRAALKVARAAIVERYPEYATAAARNEAEAKWRAEREQRDREETQRRRRRRRKT